MREGTIPWFISCWRRFFIRVADLSKPSRSSPSSRVIPYTSLQPTNGYMQVTNSLQQYCLRRVGSHCTVPGIAWPPIKVTGLAFAVGTIYFVSSSKSSGTNGTQSSALSPNPCKQTITFLYFPESGMKCTPSPPAPSDPHDCIALARDVHTIIDSGKAQKDLLRRELIHSVVTSSGGGKVWKCFN